MSYFLKVYFFVCFQSSQICTNISATFCFVNTSSDFVIHCLFFVETEMWFLENILSILSQIFAIKARELRSVLFLNCSGLHVTRNTTWILAFVRVFSLSEALFSEIIAKNYPTSAHRDTFACMWCIATNFLNWKAKLHIAFPETSAVCYSA